MSRQSFFKKILRFRLFDKEMTDAFFGVGTMGMHLVGSTFIGLLIGYYLDKWLDPEYGTKPYLTFFFLIMGIIAGFRNVYFEAQRIQRRVEKQQRLSPAEALQAEKAAHEAARQAAADGTVGAAGETPDHASGASGASEASGAHNNDKGR